MSDTQLVTVYIPTYNRCGLLERAVESVLNQTYTNLEVIIVDDCSPDDTLDYLAKVAKKDNRVRYFQNKKNSGACVARNKAIMEAKGEFITGLDDDDYFLPERIENFVNNIHSENHEVQYSNYILINNESNKKIKRKPKKIMQNNLLVSNYIGNQVFCRTYILRSVMFDIHIKKFQDLDCWYRLLHNISAKNSGKFDYVIDHSHPHERITKQNNTKESIEYLSKKNSDDFSLHLLGYENIGCKQLINESILNAPGLYYLFRAYFKILYYCFNKL